MKIKFFIIMLLIFSCAESELVFDKCDITKVIVKSDSEIIFEANDGISISQILRRLKENQPKKVKFKPEYWIELEGLKCTIKVGVKDKFMKVNGKSYLLSKTLDDLVQ